MQRHLCDHCPNGYTCAPDVEQRHRETIMSAIATHGVNAMEQHHPIVDDAVMGEHGPFGEAGCAGGVQDQHRIRWLDRCLSLAYLLIAHCGPARDHLAEQGRSPALLL